MGELGKALQEEAKPLIKERLLKIRKERRLLASLLGDRSKREVREVAKKYYEASLQDLLEDKKK